MEKIEIDIEKETPQQRLDRLKRQAAYYSAFIKKIREERGMTQEEFANKCGHYSNNARSWASKVESGKIKLSLDDAEAVSKALDVSPLDLLGMNNTLDAGEDASKFNLTDQDIYFIKDYKKLSEKGKSKARERIEELLQLEGKL